MSSTPHVLVLGLGSSGEAAVWLLLAEGARVTGLDEAASAPLQARAAVLERAGVRVRLGPGALPEEAYDLCVVSPGVPRSHEWVRAAERRRVPVLSELELAWSRARGPVLAVTGSNGKSTAVKWCTEALRAAGRAARLAGNYGVPFSREVRIAPEADPWVLEVSSFQLETTVNFRADVAVLLNVQPNHLDRHGDMETYLRCKARLFAAAREQDVCVVPRSWLDRVRERAGGRGAWVTFGAEADADYVYCAGAVLHRGHVAASLKGSAFDNPVMGPSAAAVVAALDRFGVRGEEAVGALRRMTPLPHRMELVAELRGVRFINDSKATNLSAMVAGLQLAGGPVRLIAGGLAKGEDPSAVAQELAAYVRAVYLIGASAEAMERAWSGTVPCFRCGDLATAVRRAWQDAQAGEAVLLAPGCASFDQFRNFEERGERFVEVVKTLAAEGRI